MNRTDSAQAMQSLIGYYDDTDSEDEDGSQHGSTKSAIADNENPIKNNDTPKHPEYSELSASDIDLDIEDEDEILSNKSINTSVPKGETTPDKTSKVQSRHRSLVSYDVSIIETPNKSRMDNMDGNHHISVSDEEEDDEVVSLNRYRSPEDSENESEHTMAVDDGEGEGCIDIEGLPPAPTTKCSQALQDKILSFHVKMNRDGIDLNTVIQQRKDFRNPSIYEKLVQYCDIDEKGTNYPLSLYDPTIFGPESYYEELAKCQKIEMEKIEKEKKERTKVEFVTGMKKNHLSDTDLKRKSKWDDPKEDIKKRYNYNRV